MVQSQSLKPEGVAEIPENILPEFSLILLETSLIKTISWLTKFQFLFQELVLQYVIQNNMKTNFKEQKPGSKWIRKFLKRNKLTTKKAEMIISYLILSLGRYIHLIYIFSVQVRVTKGHLKPS